MLKKGRYLPVNAKFIVVG